MMFHTYLKDIYACDISPDSQCCCRYLLLEELVIFLQNSGVTKEFSELCASLNLHQASSSKDLTRPLLNNFAMLPALTTFFQLCESLNTKIQKFLTSLSEIFDSRNLLHSDRKTYAEIQSTICSVVLSSQTRIQIEKLVELYLCLELEAAECGADSHVFSSVVRSSSDQSTDAVIELGRLLGCTWQWFSLTSFYFSSIIPYAKAALTSRMGLLCAENYSESFIDAILDYKERVMKNMWISRIFEDQHARRLLSSELSDELIYGLFYEVRKPDVFSIIIEFPDSMNSLLDLGKCLEHVPFRQSLITHLSEGVKQRLLHPGVHTEQILVAYSYLVRALRLVDKSYLVQDVVCRPVSLCLRQREDAVRCIVDKLLSNPDADKAEDDDGDIKLDGTSGVSTELYSELLLRKPLEVEPADAAEDSDSEMVAEDPSFDEDVQQVSHSDPLFGSLKGWGGTWLPDPIEAVHQGGLWRRRMDLLSMLVSIYGSKKAFLVEYKQLLSQRLLKQRSFHTAHELRNLELLKLRFGEHNLVECEVMLKDIRDSKRIAALVSEGPQSVSSKATSVTSSSKSDNVKPRSRQSEHCNSENVVESNALFPLSAYILSVHYWPELLDEKFKLPDGLRGTFDSYERAFQRLKGNRSLQWMHKLGLVNIELELGGRQLKLDVTPLQASIAYLFTKKRRWTSRNLAQELDTPISNVRSGLHAFIQLGFLRKPTVVENEDDKGRSEMQAEVYEVYDAKATAEDHVTGSVTSGTVSSGSKCLGPSSSSWIIPEQEDGIESAVSSVRSRKEKELQMFWSYIVAMLTNLGGLSLDRIHSMLRMFALGSSSGLDCGRDELRHFLDQKLRESELIFDGEVYKLSKVDI